MPTSELLEQVVKDARHLLGQGKVADYIPALATRIRPKIGYCCMRC